MTLDELESKFLPNGLHDAELVALCVDYASLKMILDVNVDMSEPPVPAPDYKAARITFSEVQFVIVDPPGPGQTAIAALPMIDSGSGEPEIAPTTLPPLRPDCFLSWIFVTDWNSFIRIAAKDTAIEWRDESAPSR